jgi:hypothetical protein
VSDRPVHFVGYGSQPYVTIACTEAEAYVSGDYRGAPKRPENVGVCDVVEAFDTFFTFDPALVTCDACRSKLPPEEPR